MCVADTQNDHTRVVLVVTHKLRLTGQLFWWQMIND